MFGSQPPHPPTFGRDLPKKNGFFLAAPLIVNIDKLICCYFGERKKVPQDKGQIYLQSGQEGLGKVGGSGG